ncbi:MerR family transcriptional regulator [Saccharothrix australiensis]|uniref:DNA-binding transcriptional MerR regulator n=1 Tax=Saccharothrix australiensis TaxID=2072 RepID=A0A495VX10_9PSEU|nr:MerR family transcriptional regulator [Saccharothrix australiensis]RKT53277.1 DNA-binding transcriptional MerR regulator [Saccharothrix australiensis]
MLIGELSERTGATVRMLRYYEQQGLLRPRRTGSRYRVYDEADVERVRSVRCLIGSGLNVRLVRLVLAHAFGEQVDLPADEARCVPLLEMLQDELGNVAQRIEALERTRTHLSRLVSDVEVILAARRGEGVDGEACSGLTAGAVRAHVEEAGGEQAGLARAGMARADVVGAEVVGADVVGAEVVGAEVVGAEMAR